MAGHRALSSNPLAKLAMLAKQEQIIFFYAGSVGLRDETVSIVSLPTKVGLRSGPTRQNSQDGMQSLEESPFIKDAHTTAGSSIPLPACRISHFFSLDPQNISAQITVR